MSGSVSTISTLINLTTNLIERIQDRKLAAEMRDIQRLILTLQSEHLALQENRIELKSECAELKQRLSILEPQIVEMKDKTLSPKR